MHHTRTTVTCLPVQLDGGQWSAAIFFVLPEDFDEPLIQRLFTDATLFSVGIEADLKEQDTATLITLGVEIDLGTDSSLMGEIVFLTGYLDTHFDTVQSLSRQSGINLFIGDCYCNLLHQQSIPLGDEHRAVLAQLLQEASSRDALIRFRGQYDPEVAFKELTGHTGGTTPLIN